MTLITFLLFIAGFVVLVRGAEWLIEGAASIAKKLGISDLIVGLTVVAFGTSLPELIVNLFAGGESADLAIGNVVGSNIANILLVLGVASILRPLSIHRTIVNREVIFNIFAAAALALLVSERLLHSGGFDGLDKIDGVILMSYFVIFLYMTFGRAQSIGSTKSVDEIKTKGDHFNIATATMKLIGGAAGLYFGGKWIVEGAIEVAEFVGVSDSLIGLTVVAIGTSLPELAATFVAVREKKTDVAIGNALGSNLFNIFWVLGLSSFLNPLQLNNDLLVDIAINFGVALILWGSLSVGKYKRQLSKSEGTFFIALYVAYIIFLVIRG